MCRDFDVFNTMGETMLTVEAALAIIDKLLSDKPLTNLQELVFCESWQGKTYAEIAESSGYDHDYIRDVGFRLWHNLSEVLGEKVTKSNLQSVLRRYCQCQEGIPSVVKAQNTPEKKGVFVCPIINTCPYIQKDKVSTHPHQDWDETVDVSFFYGRTEELTALKSWTVQQSSRLVAILGMGGVGKTALAVKLAQEIQGEFDYIIWRSLRNLPSLSELLTSTIEFVSQKTEINLPKTTSGKISLLIKYLDKYRCLMIFDNFEALFAPGEKAGSYFKDYREYGELLQKIGELRHQSCLLLISNEKPAEVAVWEGEFLPVRSLTLKGLKLTAAEKILAAKGLFPVEEDSQKLIECYQGHPLALKMAANSILQLFDGNIAEFFQQGTTVFNGISHILESQIQRLSLLEKQIINLLAMHSHAVSPKQLQAYIECDLSRVKLLEALESLSWRSLIEIHTAGFTLQPWVKEYIKEQLNPVHDYEKIYPIQTLHTMSDH